MNELIEMCFKMVLDDSDVYSIYDSEGNTLQSYLEKLTEQQLNALTEITIKFNAMKSDLQIAKQLR